MVEGMSVVVNIMLSLITEMSPTIGTHGGEVKYFGCVCFKTELGFLNCDNICMCVVNKQFELLEFVLIPFMLTCSMMRFISLLLLGQSPCVVCGHVVMWSYGRLWSVCKVDVVPYVGAVVSVVVVRLSVWSISV